ncbi:hypothetical protein AV530_003577 [Patagioenas fasciata monilis]|uniref:Uncharacterized protein n=1 Tax=Patagioenas fasciata monilis TaxID=372326 RepID=A0A1V4KY00_PATFA|nr:hypothetical protein AV530_003577 [Patagioenas fasciata monilis]
MMVDSASGILCFVQIHSSGPFPSVSSLQKTLEGVRWSSAESLYSVQRPDNSWRMEEQRRWNLHPLGRFLPSFLKRGAALQFSQAIVTAAH